jgi:hypothetical protein
VGEVGAGPLAVHPDAGGRGQFGQQRLQRDPLPPREGVEGFEVAELRRPPLGLAVPAEHRGAARVVRRHLADGHVRPEGRPPRLAVHRTPPGMAVPTGYPIRPMHLPYRRRGKGRVRFSAGAVGPFRESAPAILDSLAGAS